MTSIVIRDVPDDVLATLKERAAKEGKSLQAYVLELLTREATTPTNAELAERMRRTANLSPYDAAYVALAEAVGTTLVTADGRIKRSGAPTCPIEVV